MATKDRSFGRTLALAVLLAIFWLLLSGRIGIQYFVFMIVSVGLVLWMNPERPFRPRGHSWSEGIASRLRSTGRLFRYLGWLVWNVIKANIDVAYRILHPSLPIRPRLLVFRTNLQHEVAQVLVANSITLTPGTVTVDLKDGEYLVHALHPAAATAVTGGELQNLVGPVFGEGAQTPPILLWGSSLEDLRGSPMAREYREKVRALKKERLADASPDAVDGGDGEVDTP